MRAITVDGHTDATRATMQRASAGAHALLLALVTTISLGLSGMGHAQAVNAGPACDIKVVPPAEAETDGPLTVRAYDEFTVTGHGFPPNTYVEISVYGNEGDFMEYGLHWDVTSDSDGAFVQDGVWIWNDRTAAGSVVADVFDALGDYVCSDRVELSIAPATPFTDTYHHRWERYIAWLWRSGITSGCSPTLFCPNGSVTREQMASFLARALALPAATRDYFTDDETSKHEANINRIAEARITVGCAGTNFCPSGTVTREQMASFLARALALPAATRDYFTDDETSKHEANINRMAAARITVGCTATTFCPKGTVTRAQMAAFLFRALHD